MRRHAFTIYFNTPGDGGAGAGSGTPGGPAPSDPGGSAAGGASGAPASATPSAPGGAPAPGVTPPAGTGVQPPAAAPTQFSFPEDRSNWVPPTRIGEIAARTRQAELERDRFRAMLEAGTGVRMREEARVPPEVQEAQRVFASVFPGVAQLESIAPLILQFMQAMQQGGVRPEAFAQLPQVIESDGWRWAQQGRQTLDTIHAAVAKDYGLETLTPRQQKVVGTAFMDWLQEDPARTQRYTLSDPRLTDEFLTEYRTGFVDPLRRASDAAAMAGGNRNAGLPRAPRSGGMVPPPAAPAAPLTADQVHDNAWQAFNAMQRANG